MKHKSSFYLIIMIIVALLIVSFLLILLLKGDKDYGGGVNDAPSSIPPLLTLDMPAIPLEIIERVPIEKERIEVDIEDTEGRIQAILEAIENEE